MELLSENLRSKQFVFIVGAPRSGTTWIQTFLEAHPDIASLPGVELRHFSEYLAPLFGVWDKEKGNIDNKRWVAGLPYIWTEQEFNSFIAEFTSKVYEKVLEKRPGAKIILDKHPGYSFSIEQILRVIPNARFIHVIRDARDAVTSFMSAGKRVGFGFPEADRASKYWRDCVLACKSAAKKNPGQFLEIRYEDLSNDKKSIKPILDFIGASSDELILDSVFSKAMDGERVSVPDPKFLKMRSEGKKVWREELSGSELLTLATICDPLLTELSYIQKGENWTGIHPVQEMIIKVRNKILYK